MLPFSFIILQLLGFLRPQGWMEKWKKSLYDCYTIVILFLLYTNIIFQSVYAFAFFESIDQFIDNTFILLTTINSAFKATSFVLHRHQIIRLLKTYQNQPCTPQNLEEEWIRSTCDRIIYNISLIYISFTMCTVSLQTGVKWSEVVPQKDLIYNAWLPFNNSRPILYWISHIHQVICQMTDAAVSCSYMSIVAGLMIKIIGQFEILACRFISLPNAFEINGQPDNRNDMEIEKVSRVNDNGSIFKMESEQLAQCVEHHLLILDCFDESSEVFSGAMFAQYMTSSFILCGTVYKLSKMHNIGPELIGVFMYLGCMLFDIFLPCFYGHRVTLESLRTAEAVYNMNWYSMSTSSKRSLVLIMNRCLKPIRFTSGYILELSLDSFSGLIKMSYSIFNLLSQQSG